MNGESFDEDMLTRGLQLLAAEMESQEAPPELELKLREAFRNDRTVIPIKPARAAKSRYWLVAVAACLLVVVSAIAMWWRSSDSPQKTVAKTTPPKQVQANDNPPNIANPPSAAPKEVEYRADNSPRRETPKPLRRNTGTRRAPNTQMANHVTNEIATDFLPLGYINPASLQEGGQIVRVTLRRSALAKFGIPVNMDRYNENVKADVLLGIDGLAHAIRFVQ